MRGRAVMAVLLLLLFTGLAEGATLLSPPLHEGVDGTLVCMIANVGTRTRAVTFEWTARDGSQGTVTLNMAAETSVGVFTGAAGGICRFIAPGGKSQYRAVACIREGIAPTCAGAVEAR